MLLKRIFLPALALALLLAPALHAQTPKPVMVVSISGIDELMGDIDYITKSAGVEDYGNLFKLLAAPYTVGIDKTKPWGLIVRSAGEEPIAVGFVPVKDLDVVFAALREQIGEPRDAGDGVFEITDPAPMFIKEKGGYAFLANESKYLKDLPADPVKALDGLNKKYDVAVRAFGQNIPQEQKDWAIGQIKDQQKKTLERQLRGLDEDDPQYKLAKRVSENQVQRLSDMINDADELTFGWATEPAKKQMYVDVSLTAKDGSPTAKRFALLRDNTSAYGGFDLPGAAATFNITARMDKEDIEQLTAVIDAVKAKAFEEIEKDNDLDTDAKREKAKEVVGGLIDTLGRTIEAGKLDGGAALMLAPKSMTLVAGGKVADPKELEASLRKLVDLAKNEPDFPAVKFNAEKHKGVTFHTMSIPVPEKDARKVLGEELDVAVGIGKDSAYLAFGKDASGTLKKVIDRSSMVTQDAPPMLLNVALTPIFKFAGSVQDNPVLELITATLEKTDGKDHIIVKASTTADGVNYRLTIEEGILKAIGQAVKFRQGGL